VDPATGDVPAPGDGAVHGIDGETRFHSVADRVPDDPVAEDVRDCAEVELAFTGFVLRMPLSQSRFGASAVNSRRTRSSCTGGPGRRAFPRRRVPNANHQPLSRQRDRRLDDTR